MEELKIIMEAVNGMTEGALYGFIVYILYLTLTSFLMWGSILLIIHVIAKTLIRLNNEPEVHVFSLGKGEVTRYFSENDRKNLVSALDRLVDRIPYSYQVVEALDNIDPKDIK